jgi:hypothetical protein
VPNVNANAMGEFSVEYNSGKIVYGGNGNY